MAGGRNDAGDEGFAPVLRGAAGVDDRGGLASDGNRDGDGSDGAARDDPDRDRLGRRDPRRPGDGFGPVVRGRRRPRALRLARPGGGAVKFALIVVLVAALAVTGTLGGLLIYFTLAIDRVAVRGLEQTGGRANVLVVGSDSREGLTDAQLQALGTEAVEGRRTDSILLLSIRGGAAALLSFPRDLYVPQCDGSMGRINAAYSSGGPDCLVQTVTGVSGIPVSHYLEVDFAGFLQVVDAVGGVEVFLDQPMVDRAAGVDLPAGCVVLDGRQALGFVRARNVDDDLGRIARQQRFLSQLAAAVAEPSTLLDVPRLFRIVQAAAEAVTADQRLGLADVARLARAGRGLAAGGLATYTVPATPRTVGGNAVLVPTEGADAIFSRFQDGSILEVPPQPEVGLQPGDVELDVLNGAGVGGLAARGRDYLTARGFRVDEVGNAALVDRTVVRHAPGHEAAALLVAAQLPGAAVELSDAGGPELALVLGPDADLSAPPPEPAPPGAPADTDQGPPAATGTVGAGTVPDSC